MSKFTYNPNNTEGKYPTAFEVRDMELRKDDKAVATDLVDLYDVEITDPQDKEIIVYNTQKSKWVNGEPGAVCDIIDTDTTITVGTNGDYPNLKTCFDDLRANCTKIAEDVYLYILLLSDLEIEERTSLNHPYGHRIIIKGDNHTISNHRDASYYIHYVATTIGTKEIEGDHHALMIASDDTLWGGGLNHHTQLGIPNESGGVIIPEYTLISDEQWKSIAVTSYGSLAIKMDGTLWVCGWQLYGELGLGIIDEINEWQQIGTDTDWENVYAYNKKSYAIKNDGSLWQTGRCTNGTFNTWTQFGTDTDWKAVYPQSTHCTIIMKNDGKIWLCGTHFLTNEDHPDPVLFDNNVWDKIAVGEEFIIGMINSRLFGIGNNTYGQLGLGEDTLIQTWTLTADGSYGWYDIKAGFRHSIAYASNNSIWTCGDYRYNGLNKRVNSLYFEEEPQKYRDWKSIFTYVRGVGGNRPPRTDIECEHDIYYRSGDNYNAQLGNVYWDNILPFFDYNIEIILIPYVDNNQIKKINNSVISVSNNHTITFYNTNFRNAENLHRVYDRLYTDAYSIYIFAFTIENNANAIFEYCSFYDKKWALETYPINGMPNPNRYLKVNNNASAIMTNQYNVFVNNASRVILNNSFNYTTEFIVTAKNNSKVIISSRDMQYMTPEIENSEIIEFLKV
jgi:alpha-tubulin suppressor-like RCC1 family protein